MFKASLRRLSFNLWYFGKPPWDTGISPPELIDFIANHTPGRALDLGCGTGTNVITLAKHGWQVTGVDFAPKAIRAARRKAADAGVKVDLFVDDVSKLVKLRGRFDLILDIGCLHSLPPQSRVAYRENLRRLLAPGGTYLIYGFTESNDGGPGLLPEDIAGLARDLSLVQRVDGSDHGSRSSAWFTYNSSESRLPPNNLEDRSRGVSS